jgi:hypothetical protein
MKHGTVEFGLAGSVSGNCSFVDANVEAGCALMTDRFRSSMPGRRGKDIGGAGIGHVHRYGKLRTWISERGMVRADPPQMRAGGARSARHLV